MCLESTRVFSHGFLPVLLFIIFFETNQIVVCTSGTFSWAVFSEWWWYQTTVGSAHLKQASGYSQLYLAATIPANNRQHLLAYWWRGGGGQLFKCDRWSLVSGCCCCSFPRLPSHPQRGWEEREPQHSSAEKLSVAVQSVFRRRAHRRPLLSGFWFSFIGFVDWDYLDEINNNLKTKFRNLIVLQCRFLRPALQNFCLTPLKV